MDNTEKVAGKQKILPPKAVHCQCRSRGEKDGLKLRLEDWGDDRSTAFFPKETNWKHVNIKEYSRSAQPAIRRKMATRQNVLVGHAAAIVDVCLPQRLIDKERLCSETNQVVGETVRLHERAIQVLCIHIS